MPTKVETNKDSLPSRQHELLQVLAKWPAGELPRLSSIARKMGVASESGVRRILDPLIERGFARRESMGTGLPNLPYVTEAGRKYLQGASSCEVGRIVNNWLDGVLPVNPLPCGVFAATAPEPTFIVERLGDVFHEYLHGDQLHIAKGDSMVSDDARNDSIPPGAHCLIRPDIWPQDGETIYVEIEMPDGGRECTLKDVFFDHANDLVILQARNEAYEDIVLPTYDLSIIGVVRDVIARPRRAHRRHKP